MSDSVYPYRTTEIDGLPYAGGDKYFVAFFNIEISIASAIEEFEVRTDSTFVSFIASSNMGLMTMFRKHPPLHIFKPYEMGPLED